MKISHKAPQTSVQVRDWPIAHLPGLSKENQSQLEECSITTTGQLIRMTKTQAAKVLLANQLQINIQYINKWVAMANLARIPSVGCQYCGLLLHAGVASPAQLAQMPVERLHQQILRLHVATMQRNDLTPSVDRVQKWVQQARLVSSQ
jgi:predicted flap endonuclease-1-like 5' DNA nuclease